MKYLGSLAIVFVLSGAAFSQQDYVPRYEGFAGYTYFTAPNINLVQRGYNLEFGVNLNSWLIVGGDYSWFQGHSDITVPDLTPAVQARLAPFLPVLGPNPKLPFEGTTNTFTAGVQFNYRKLRWITLFARPAIGGLHESATLNATSPALALVVQAIAPGGKKTDLQPFYGVGGGFDLNVSRHVGLRVSADFVHVSLFSDLLANPRNGARVSMGPTFRFGRNVAEAH